MIKILGICGSPVKQGNTEAVLAGALSHLKPQDDIRTELLPLAEKRFGGCNHCNWCVKRQSPGRFCQQEDDMTPIYEKLVEADAVLLASPVHFGRLSGLMANMIDRLRAFVHGNRYAGRLRNKIGGALAVAFFRGGGIETTLQSLNAAFFCLEMIPATSRLYQLGAGALSSEDGKGGTRKGVRHMALEDGFGEASAVRLVERMVELARMVKAGQGEAHP
jgi:multimeric flavodoxin WrbA